MRTIILADACKLERFLTRLPYETDIWANGTKVRTERGHHLYFYEFYKTLPLPMACAWLVNHMLDGGRKISNRQELINYLKMVPKGERWVVNSHLITIYVDTICILERNTWYRYNYTNGIKMLLLLSDPNEKIVPDVIDVVPVHAVRRK
jgi:hypothetical protein